MTRALALLVLAVALATAGPASAAKVAESQGYVLDATDTDDEGFCLTLTGPGVIAGPDCTNDPLGQQDDILQLRAPGVFAAAVAPAVRTVTVDAVQSFPTASAPGFKARFVLVPGAATGRVLRFFDEADALFGAAVDRNADPLGPTQTLLDGAVGQGGVTVTAGFAVRPDPAMLDRTVTVQCITGGFDDPQRDCATHDEWIGRRLAAANGCGTRRTLVFGFVPAAARRVRLLLTTGRRRMVPAQRLAAEYEDLRAVAARLPLGVGVRTATLVGLGREMPLGVGPGCADPDVTVRFDGRRPPRGLTPIPIAQDFGHRLVVADDTNRRLCVAIDRLTRPCTVPAVKAADSVLYQEETVVGGVVPRTTDRVALVLADGGVRTVSPVDGTGYPGFYAGQVRFIYAEVDEPVTSAIVYGPRGAELGTADVVLAPRFTRTGGIPATPLAHATLTSKRDVLDCVALRRADVRANACRRGAADLAVGAAASCAPGRLVVFGLLPRDATAVTVILARGEVTATIADGAWFAEIPPGRAVRGLTVTGPAPDTVNLELPRAKDQCGYQLLQS